jgi:hypothetical protein
VQSSIGLRIGHAASIADVKANLSAYIKASENELNDRQAHRP